MGFSLVVSKKVPATWCDFCSWFQKKCLLPGGIFIFFFRFWNLKLDFFPIEKVFRKTAKTKNFSTLEVIMSEISANLKNIFWPRKPPILKLEVGFFSDRKRFSQIFENRIFFFHLKFISIKKKKKSEKLFWSLTQSLITTAFGRGRQEGGVGVREANYVRVSKLRQVYKLRQECKLRQACKLRRATAVVRGLITASYGRR